MFFYQDFLPRWQVWWCGCAENKWRWMKKKHLLLLLPVCLALHMHKSDGFPINKQRKCHNCDGNSCLHLCFPLSFCVSLSRCQKSSCSWPTLKKKDTKNCIPSWHVRIPVGAEHEDLEDWERRRTSGERDIHLLWLILSFSRVTVFLPVGAAFIVNTYKVFTMSIFHSRRKTPP